MFSRSNRTSSPSRHPNGPDVWGPHYWYFLHWHADVSTTTFVNRTSQIAWLLRNLHMVLPCPSCAVEAYEYSSKRLEQFPYIVNDARAYVSYWRNMHNHVNRRLGKPLMIIEPLRSDYSLSTWWYHCSIVIRTCIEDFASRTGPIDDCVTFVNIILDSHPSLRSSIVYHPYVVEARTRLSMEIGTPSSRREAFVDYYNAIETIVMQYVNEYQRVR
ncbi:25.3 kDa Evrl/Alr thiol oxidase [Spodoptera frugiperda ascovirus 1a]|uniref:Sulfhydryl oxidase n=1 Tax=Spodoptera frugiperda ascovirus 1a TaxID=113370 RepID=Q0E540_SFAVA|nr:25.3 kDa Evrl/Alr thiol oxidase [Spodoptera frugiperda ascovirus 1a]CAL44661.1 25.3 kDa Evrl/Alr thiol oxidase [Spodoptera frugiperda ascovirus 1a]